MGSNNFLSKRSLLTKKGSSQVQDLAMTVLFVESAPQWWSLPCRKTLPILLGMAVFEMDRTNFLASKLSPRFGRTANQTKLLIVKFEPGYGSDVPFFAENSPCPTGPGVLCSQLCGFLPERCSPPKVVERKM